MEGELDISVTNNPERSRYEVAVDGVRAAYSTYELEGGRVLVTHTVVRPQFEGRGIGSRLARFAVEDIRDRGLRIKPVCTFTRSWLRAHPEYESIVDYPAED